MSAIIGCGTITGQPNAEDYCLTSRIGFRCELQVVSANRELLVTVGKRLVWVIGRVSLMSHFGSMSSSRIAWQKGRSAIMIGWPRHTGMALGITTSVKIIRRFWMRLRTILPIPFLIWVVGPAETFTIFVYWGTTL